MKSLLTAVLLLVLTPTLWADTFNFVLSGGATGSGSLTLGPAITGCPSFGNSPIMSMTGNFNGNAITLTNGGNQPGYCGGIYNAAMSTAVALESGTNLILDTWVFSSSNGLIFMAGTDQWLLSGNDLGIGGNAWLYDFTTGQYVQPVDVAFTLVTAQALVSEPPFVAFLAIYLLLLGHRMSKLTHRRSV